MATRFKEGRQLREQVARLFAECQEPDTREVCDLLQELFDGGEIDDRAVGLERLKREVYRVRIGDRLDRSMILKRLKPATAQTDRLVADRWLPALGLGDRCPRLLGAAAARDGEWVWHVYEDLGRDTLADHHDPPQLEAAIELLAELHSRGAGDPVILDVRWRARDLGAHFFTANLEDAIAALDALATFRCEGVPDFPAARARLLDGLRGLLADTPRRLRAIRDYGSPDTLLHGDLWPKNVFVSASRGGPRARLIDWDHVGLGSYSYDLSTFLYRTPAAVRLWVLQRYRRSVARYRWQLPENTVLNLLFHTAECARYAHCILFDALNVLHDGEQKSVEELMEFDRWLAMLHPPLPE